MNTDELTYQTLIDTVMAVSITWIDRLPHAVAESTVLEYTKQVLLQHVQALTHTQLLHVQQHLHAHGLLQCDAHADMHQAVHNSLWNTIEIELSKLYA
jgi:hypothetical protein